jgi:hypothetical protein
MRTLHNITQTMLKRTPVASPPATNTACADHQISTVLDRAAVLLLLLLDLKPASCPPAAGSCQLCLVVAGALHAQEMAYSANEQSIEIGVALLLNSCICDKHNINMHAKV